MNTKLKGNLLYGQSGGPTSIINSSAYGLFKEAFKSKYVDKVYAMHYGIKGLLNDDLIKVINSKNLKKLVNTPGAAFGSNRYKLKEINEDLATFQFILEQFKKYNIRYFFYNGGNDSMDTINKISKFLIENNYQCNCIGINKTIDNDLMESEFSLGFASSAKFIINSVVEIALDDLSYETGRVNIIETMGRESGFLAASSICAKVKNLSPDLIYVPEVTFDLEDFIKKVKEIYTKKKHCLVVVSEGIKSKDNDFIQNNNIDAFNHPQLGGVAISLANIIKEKLNFPTRYFELSLLQRANSIISSHFEQKMAINLSSFALKLAIKGITNKVVVIKKKDNKFYFDFVNIDQIANKVKYLPLEYIDTKNSTIKPEYINYILPLIDSKDGILDVYLNK